MTALLNNIADVFDLPIFVWVQNNLWNPVLTAIMAFVSFLGENGSIFIPMVIILLCFKKTRKLGVTMGAALIFMELVNNEIIKNIVARPRPFNYFNWDPDVRDMTIFFRDGTMPFFNKTPGSWSFPSGHTSSAFAAAMAFAMNTKGTQGKDKTKMIWGSVIFFIFAAIMGFSRIYLHDHYPSDVICGAVLGVLYGLIGYYIGKAVYDAVKKKLDAKKAAKAQETAAQA
ncbi:MAG: phosphatase PAP2 family protein [Clostridia bacterium]|nr:phosphatase PAP2 family protein [Clostridia bacterium]